jgi:flagellum-specific peptidoglycan hydrolase FlgJ
MLTKSKREANLRLIARAAVKSEKSTGLPAELTAAQCILESGWLEHAPGNNCFGIKDTDRFPGVQYKMTEEWRNGKLEDSREAFEVYPDLSDCFTDHANLLTGNPAYSVAWEVYLRGGSVLDLIQGISTRYATDKKYPSKIARLARQCNVREALEAARAEAD